MIQTCFSKSIRDEYAYFSVRIREGNGNGYLQDIINEEEDPTLPTLRCVNTAGVLLNIEVVKTK